MESIDKQTKTSNLSRFLGTGFTYFLGDSLIRGLGLILLPIYTHYLSVEDYGIIGLSLSFSALLAPILGWSLLTAVMRFYITFETREERRKFLGTLLFFLLIVSGGISLALILLGRQNQNLIFREVPFSPFLSLAVVLSYLTTLMNILPLGIFRIREEPKKYVLLAFTQASLSGLLTVMAIGPLKQGAEGALFARVIASIIVLSIGLFITRGEYSMKVSIEYLKMALKLTIPIIPHSLAQWILGLSDKWLLERLSTLQAVGVYTAAYQLGVIVMQVNQNLFNVWIPVFFKQVDNVSNYVRIKRFGTYYIMVMCFAALVISSLGVDIFLLVTPDDYSLGRYVIPLVAMGGVALGIYQIFVTSILYSKQTKWLPIASFIAGISNIVLNIIFIPRFGIIAPAFNTLLGYSVLATIVGFMSRRILNIRYEYHRWVLLVLVCVSLICLAIPDYPVFPFLSIVIHIFLLLLFPVILYFLRFWSKKEIGLITKEFASIRNRLLS